MSTSTRTTLATNAIGNMATSMIALCSTLLRAVRYMKSTPSADRLNIVLSPEHASATSISYWPTVSTTPLRATG